MDPVGPVENDARLGAGAEPNAADVSAAQRTLEEARSRLDAALARIPEMDDDEAMATPQLLLLLVDAVDAKKRLDALEVLPVCERK